VISSRRLAREWALKILYQVDVGKVTLAEARDSAMERLRMEFVQRGSRAAAGSTAEMLCISLVTGILTPSLPVMRPALERAILLTIDRAFEALPYLQESYFETSYRNKIKGSRLHPAHLLDPPSEQPVYGKDEAAAAALTNEERALLRSFLQSVREGMPAITLKEMRRAARATAAAVYEDRSEGNYSTDALLEHRSRMVEQSQDRWSKVSQAVQKQTAEWLHVASFTSKLVNAMEINQPAVDETLETLTSGWKLERQVAVDRNIMRLAAMEMMCLPEMPASVSINEAVELAKKYSTAESGRFVNGVLGALEAKTGSKSLAGARESAADAEIIDAAAELEDDLIELTDGMDEYLDAGDADSFEEKMAAAILESAADTETD
jgi:transcription antitermination factor NusB